jgi:hypothetical protein
MFGLDWVEALMKSPYPTVQRYCALLRPLITSHSSLNHYVTAFNHVGHLVLQILVTSILKPRRTSRPANTCDVSCVTSHPSATDDISSYIICDVSSMQDITSYKYLWRHILQPRRTSRPTNTCDVSSFHHAGHHVLQILMTSHLSTTQDITSYNICDVSSFNHTGHHILKILVTSQPSHHAGNHVLQILMTSHPSATHDGTSFNHFWRHILQPFRT